MRGIQARTVREVADEFVRIAGLAPGALSEVEIEADRLISAAGGDAVAALTRLGGVDRSVQAALGARGSKISKELGDLPEPTASSLRVVPTDRFSEFLPAGDGGMGIVYMALDTELNRLVAFKMIRPRFGAGERDDTTVTPMQESAPARDTGGDCVRAPGPKSTAGSGALLARSHIRYTGRMPDIGRNQPCPCGSGKKFKRCCLAKHAEGDDVSRAQRLHALDRRLISDIIEWSEHGEPALYTWALGMNAIEDEDDPVLDDIADSSLAVVTGPLDRTLATVFLEAKEGQLLDYESAWLRAVIDSWLGLWEVQSVTRGRGVRVRDLLTEQRREVLDVGLSESISRGSVVCARVVDFDGLTLFTCVHPRALDRLRTEQVIDAHLLEEDGPLPHPSDLYRGENANELLRFWDHNTRPTLPTLQNRDGDVLQETRDTLTFSPDDRSEIVDRMKGLTEFHEADDESMHFSFVRESDQTVLGTVNVRAQDMIIETTSEIRADDLLVHVLEAVRGLVEHADRERRDMQDFLASGMGRGPGPSAPPDVLTGPEADEMVLQYKTQAYATWPDTSLPMLEGATPRESMDDPALRRRIVAVLTDIANGEASLPPGQRYDVGILRTALGIGDDE